MSEATAIELSETCWCGTSISVKGVTWAQASKHVAAWRVEHRHREGREVDHIGFTATGFARETGQPASMARPWSAT